MLNKIGWERTPAALRLGLLVTIASHVVRFGLALALGGDNALDMHSWIMTAEGLCSGLWVVGDLLCIVGAVQLARRAPTAWTLVISYAVGFAMYAGWMGVEALELGDGGFAWVDRLRYLELAATVLTIIGWSIIAQNPGYIVMVAIGSLAASLPPALDQVYERLGIESYRAHQLFHNALHFFAALGMLGIALGVPFARPDAPRPLATRAFDAMAGALAAAGLALAGLAWCGMAGHLGVALTVVAVAGLVWFAVVAANARRAGDPGAWTLLAASATLGFVAFGLFDMLPAMWAADHGARVSYDPPILLVPILQAAGVVVALTAMQQIARGRGAQHAARIAGISALVAGAAGIGAVLGAKSDASWHELLSAACTLASFAAAGFGLARAARELGDGGELPSARRVRP